MERNWKLKMGELRKRFPGNPSAMLDYLTSLFGMEKINWANAFGLARRIYLSKEFNSLPTKEQARLALLLDAFGEAGNGFFIKKLMPKIWGSDLRLEDLQAEYDSAKKRSDKVVNLDLLDLLDSQGRIDQKMVRFARYVFAKKNVKTVVLMPTIGDDRRLRCGTQLMHRILSNVGFDQAVLGAQILGTNEHRLVNFQNELYREALNDRLSSRPAQYEEACLFADRMVSCLLTVNTTEHLFFKDCRVLPEMGIGISGGAAKSQNLWAAQLLVRQMFPQSKDVFFYLTDDDYGEMNIALDAAFHFLSGALMLVSSGRELKSLVRQAGRGTALAKSKLEKWHGKLKGCFAARSGGLRLKPDQDLLQALASGQGRQRSLSETLQAVLLEDLKKEIPVELSRNVLVKKLKEIAANRIELTPAMVSGQPGKDFFSRVLAASNLAGDPQEASSYIVDFGRAFDALIAKRQKGGRVTQEWKEIVSKVWGSELELDRLSYPLFGNFSCFWSRIADSSQFQGIGYTVETVTNVVAILKGGLATYCDGIHSHMPGDERHVSGPGGMRQSVLEAFFLMAIQCSGTRALNKFPWIEYRKEETVFRGGSGIVPLCLKDLYLPAYEQVDVLPLKTSRHAFIGLNEKVSQAPKTILAFNPILLGEQAGRLEIPDYCVLIGATPSTLAEVLALGEIKFPVFVEGGSALYVPDALTGKYREAAKKIAINWESVEQGELYWLANKLGQIEFVRVLKQHENALREAEPDFKDVSLLALSELPIEVLESYGGLADKKAVKRALNRQFPVQPFYIQAPTGISWQEVLEKLEYAVKPHWRVRPSIRFSYLFPVEVEEGQALREYGEALFGENVVYVGLGQTQQKEELLSRCDFAFVCLNGSRFVRTIPRAIELYLDMPSALSIVLRKIQKSAEEKNR